MYKHASVLSCCLLAGTKLICLILSFALQQLRNFLKFANCVVKYAKLETTINKYSSPCPAVNHHRGNIRNQLTDIEKVGQFCHQD